MMIGRLFKSIVAWFLVFIVIVVILSVIVITIVYNVKKFLFFMGW